MDNLSQIVVDLLSDGEDRGNRGKVVVDLSSDKEDSEKMVIDLSSDEEDDVNISWYFPSDLAVKRKGAGEMVSTASKRRNTKGKRAESETKKLELALIPAVPKESRDEQAIIPYSVPEKSKEITVAALKKLPRVNLKGVEPVPGVPLGCFWARSLQATKFHTHDSLIGKRVILYGLSGFDPLLCDDSLWFEVWTKFYESRIVTPVLEFVERADFLKESGVDQIVFVGESFSLMCEAMKNRGGLCFYNMYPYIRILEDANVHNPKARSFYRGLRLGPDICEGWMPPRSRRYFFLVDDNKVKYASIETSDQVFILPSNEEIIEAFDR